MIDWLITRLLMVINQLESRELCFIVVNYGRPAVILWVRHLVGGPLVLDLICDKRFCDQLVTGTFVTFFVACEVVCA